MKNALEWIKSNPIVTACAAISLVGLIVIGYFFVIVAPKHATAKSEELKQQVQRQKALQNIPVPLPNADPNAPPDTYQVVVNQKVINDVQQIYSQIQSQYEDILGNARTKNNQHHIQFLLGRGQIWPDKNPSQFFDLYVQAASDYKDHFIAVFDKQNRGNTWNMPHMVASGPPTTAQLQAILAQSAFDYISSVGAASAGDLTQDQANQLYAEQRMKLMQALNDRARRINLYVSLPPEEDIFAPKETEAGADTPAVRQPGLPFGAPARANATDNVTAGYPFHIEPWASAADPPTPEQLWEGQVQLWIMRDIMRTIHEVNNVGKTFETTGPDGVSRTEYYNVVNSPIKRLLNLKTLQGYVGLHNTGAALGDASELDLSAPSGGRAPAFASPGIVGGGTDNAPSVYPIPPAEMIEQLKPKEVTVDAPEHFGITPTGRVSNSVFDVRHTRLTLDIEAARLPAFIEALNKANFMTVVNVTVTDLDEYELLQEGYIYGHEDVVRADLIVESLWFRNWTEELMPKIVKEKLLIILPEVGANGLPTNQTDFE